MTVSVTVYLQYVSIPILNPINLTTNTPNISTAQQVTSDVYVPITTNPGWDGEAVNSLAARTASRLAPTNTTTGAQGVHVATFTSQQISTNVASSVIKKFSNDAYIASLLSICVDKSVNPNFYYVSFWNNF